MATKKTSPCLLKAGEDEPIFVLRAQDFTSPQLILEWIKINFDTCPNEKLTMAFISALEMKEWPNRKTAD